MLISQINENTWKDRFNCQVGREGKGNLNSKRIFAFERFFGWFFGDVLDSFNALLHKWKCHSDSLFTMYEAHGRYRKWAKNAIKSYTFQGCFPEGLREWILAPFLIDFGLILEGLGTPKVAKQPSENQSKKSIKSNTINVSSEKKSRSQKLEPAPENEYNQIIRERIQIE